MPISNLIHKSTKHQRENLLKLISLYVQHPSSPSPSLSFLYVLIRKFLLLFLRNVFLVAFGRKIETMHPQTIPFLSLFFLSFSRSIRACRIWSTNVHFVKNCRIVSNHRNRKRRFFSIFPFFGCLLVKEMQYFLWTEISIEGSLPKKKRKVQNSYWNRM